MATAEHLESCPQCRYDRYSYDPFCRIWCCDRCHTTETVEEKRVRDAGANAVSEPVEDMAVVPQMDGR